MVYQGRVLVSIITLAPAVIVELRRKKLSFNADATQSHLVDWMAKVAERAGLLKEGVFLDKDEFKERRYLGTGGIGRFRDVLWAAAGAAESVKRLGEDRIATLAQSIGTK